VYIEYSKNGGELVLAAALLTLAVTLALTLYAFTTKTDFTMMGFYGYKIY
jgi:FtsH-binding integral membrane protein